MVRLGGAGEEMIWGRSWLSFIVRCLWMWRGRDGRRWQGRGFGAARRAVVCKLCTWVDSNTYKINEEVFCPAVYSHFASASMCPGKMIGVEPASRRPMPHPINFTLMGQTKSCLLHGHITPTKKICWKCLDPFVELKLRHSAALPNNPRDNTHVHQESCVPHIRNPVCLISPVPARILRAPEFFSHSSGPNGPRGNNIRPQNEEGSTLAVIQAS